MSIEQEKLDKAIQYLKTPLCQQCLEEGFVRNLYEYCSNTRYWPAITQVLLDAEIVPWDYMKLHYSNFANEVEVHSVDLTTYPHEEIGAKSFSHCNLHNLFLGKSVSLLHNQAFEWCKELTSLTIPSQVKSVGQQCFSHCTSLEIVIINAPLTRLNHQTFSNCTNLKSVYLPTSISFIDRQVFSELQHPLHIHYAGTQEQWNNIKKIAGWIEHYNTCIIHCVDGNIEL